MYFEQAFKFTRGYVGKYMIDWLNCNAKIQRNPRKFIRFHTAHGAELLLISSVFMEKIT